MPQRSKAQAISGTQQAWQLASHSRSEEHTSELQSRQYLVCRLLLEKKKKTIIHAQTIDKSIPMTPLRRTLSTQAFVSIDTNHYDIAVLYIKLEGTIWSYCSEPLYIR